MVAVTAICAEAARRGCGRQLPLSVGEFLPRLSMTNRCNECVGIENVGCVQAWCPDIVPVGLDGMRNTCQKVRRSLFRHHHAPKQKKKRVKWVQLLLQFNARIASAMLRHRLSMREKRCLSCWVKKPRTRL